MGIGVGVARPLDVWGLASEIFKFPDFNIS
jgi:hypothetical protein